MRTIEAGDGVPTPRLLTQVSDAVCYQHYRRYRHLCSKGILTL